MMKYFFTLTLLALGLMAQAQPQKINYQGLAIGSNGQPIKNSNIGLRLSILDSSSTGNQLYTEIQQGITDASGQFSIFIGAGTSIIGTFANLPWGNGLDKFLKVEMDPQGGSNYHVMGTTQLVSVPYALYAEKSGNAIPGPKGDSGVSIINTTINNDSLFLFFNNGNIINTGIVKGKDGVLPNGTKKGNTTFWNGNEWEISNNLLFNNGKNLGINTSTPDSSAILEISDTTKGILFPRMTFQQKNSILNPKEGLVIYQIDSNKGVHEFDGTNWNQLNGNKITNNYFYADSGLKLFSTIPIDSGTSIVPVGESWKIVSIQKLNGFGGTLGTGTFSGCTAGSPGWNNTRCGYSTPSNIILLNINNIQTFYGGYLSSSSVIELGGFPPCSSCPPNATFNFSFESSSLNSIQLPYWLNAGDSIYVTPNLRLSVERYK